jgi:hypothetical protein
MSQKLNIATGAMLLAGLLGSQQASADSYVFVTNTTPETVTVSVNHYGTRTLTPGSEWAQEATQIAPYETKRVLRYNRNSGVKSGHTYNFTRRPDGTTDIEVVVVRDGKNLRGWLLGLVLRTVGRSVLEKAFENSVKAIEQRHADALRRSGIAAA